MKRTLKTGVALAVVMLLSVCFVFGMSASAKTAIAAAYEKAVKDSNCDYYYVYDVDKDGTTELITETSIFGVAPEYEIFTYKNGKAVSLGSVKDVVSKLYECKNSNGVYSVNEVKSNGTIRKIIIKDGAAQFDSVIETFSPETKDNFSQLKYPLERSSSSDLSLLDKATAASNDQVTGLKATKTTDTTISLSWNAVSSAQKYEVWYASSGSFSRLGTTTKTSTNVSNLKPQTEYSFKVRIVKADGSYGTYSNVLKVKTAAVTKPSQVTGLNVSAKTTNTVTLKWNAASGAQEYYVFKYVTSTGKYTQLGTTTSLSYTVTGLLENTQYIFAVQAAKTVSSTKYWGKVSDKLSVTTNKKTVTAPAKVTGLTASAKTANTVTLAWNTVSDAQKYYVFKYNSSTGKYTQVASTTAKTYKVTGLSASTTYKFAVQAMKTVSGKEYWGAKSALLSVTTPKATVTAPAKVTGLTASAKTANTVTLSWNTVSDAQKYYVFKYNSSTGKYTTVASTTAKTYKVTGLSASTTYKFAVQAMKTVSGKEYWGAKSALLTVTTPKASTVTPPAQVTGVKVSAKTSTTVTLAWSKASGAQKYVVYKYISSSKSYTKLSTVTTTTCKVTGLKASTSYMFAVRAYKSVNGKASYGAYSDKVTVKTKVDYKPYKTILKNKFPTYDGYSYDNSTEFTLYDLDKNGVKELLVRIGYNNWNLDTGVFIYTIQNGKAVKCGVLDGNPAVVDAFMYNTKQKAIYISASHLDETHDLYKLSGTKITNPRSASNTGGLYATCVYRVEGKKVSEAQYYNYYNKYFNPDDMVSFNFVDNNEYNRTKTFG